MRKIDAMVAERVMGWVWCDRLCSWCPERKDATLADTRSKQGWRPSTDIGLAWEVWSNPHVRNHVEYVMPSLRDDGTISHWVCAVTINGSRFGCVHENPATALCHAALRAVGVAEAEIQEAMR